MKDGGPAFPVTQVFPQIIEGERFSGMKGKEGMTLRDYFAAKANEFDIDNHLIEYGLKDGFQVAVRQRTREEAKFCYADAMITEKEKGASQ